MMIQCTQDADDGLSRKVWTLRFTGAHIETGLEVVVYRRQVRQSKRHKWRRVEVWTANSNLVDMRAVPAHEHAPRPQLTPEEAAALRRCVQDLIPTPTVAPDRRK